MERGTVSMRVAFVLRSVEVDCPNGAVPVIHTPQCLPPPVDLPSSWEANPFQWINPPRQIASRPETGCLLA
eukprot:scaffold28950_cov2118-Skeletonema_menzelii.AAC.1